MLLSHLLCLAGLSIASPTPLATSARAPKPQRLTVFAADGVHGVPIHGVPIDAVHRCIKFGKPVYNNVHAYHVVDLVCRFMAGDHCDGMPVLTTDSRGTEIKGWVKMSDAVKIASVYCGDRFSSSSKRAHNTDVLSAGPLGDTTVCANTTRETGPCETLHAANNTCVPLPPQYSRTLRSIYQPRGQFCRYYNTTCDTEVSQLYLDSRREDVYVQFPTYVSEGIAYVQCKRRPWRRDGESDAPVSNIGSRNLWPGEIHTCTHKWSPGGPRSCVGQNSTGDCVELKFADHNIDSLVQWQGAVCVYYASRTCSLDEDVWLVDSVKGDVYPYLGPPNDGWGARMKSFSCQSNPAGPAPTMKPRFDVTDSLRGQSGPRLIGRNDDNKTNDKKTGYGGHIMFCKGGRACSDFNAMNACQTFKGVFDRGIDTVWQDQGAVCKYFKTDCSDISAVVVVDTREGTYMGNLGGHGHQISQVLCRPGDWHGGNQEVGLYLIVKPEEAAPASEQQEYPAPPIEQRNEVAVASEASSLQPGDIRVCNGPDSSGTCSDFNAIHMCVTFPADIQRHVQSLIQVRGAKCVYYSEKDGKYCGRDIGVVWHIEERSRSVVRRSIAPLYSKGLTSVYCVPLDTATGISDEPEALPTIEASANRAEKRDTVDGPHAGTTEALPPGHVVVCKQEDYQGGCGDFDILNKCLELPAEDGTRKSVHSLRHAMGATCHCIDNSKLSTLRFKLDSPLWDICWDKVPQADAESITTICCEPFKPGQADGFAGQQTTSPSNLTPRSEPPALHQDTALLPGDVYDCVEDKTYPCALLRPIGGCNKMVGHGTTPHAHLVAQVKGALCYYWSYTSSGCEGDDKYGLITINGPWHESTRNWPISPDKVQCWPLDSAEARAAMAVGTQVEEGVIVAPPQAAPAAQAATRDTAALKARLPTIRSSSPIKSTHSHGVQTPSTPNTPIFPSSIDGKLHLYTGVNQTGQSFSYEGEEQTCQNLPLNMTIKSYTLDAPVVCTTYPTRDCQLIDKPYTNIDSTNGARRVDEIHFEIQSLACATTFPDGPAGYITACDFPNYQGCGDVRANAMERCLTFNTRQSGIASFKLTPNAQCSFYREDKCAGKSGFSAIAEWMVLEEEDLGDFGGGLYRSANCSWNPIFSG